VGGARRLLGRLDARGHGRAAARLVEERQRAGAVAQDRDAERLEQLGRRGHVEERLDPRGDDEGLRARELGEIGGDVRPLGVPTVDAPDAPGAHEANPGQARRRQRPADRGRAELAARDARAEVAGAGLARLGARVAEARELAFV
jgi:hypothetical protein